jgi:hypothetical protein
MEQGDAVSQIDKLIAKLKNDPKDFTYPELRKVFQHFGYSEDTGGRTSGAGRSFVRDNKDEDTFYLHEPHKDNELRTYTIKQAVEHLEERGLI